MKQKSKRTVPKQSGAGGKQNIEQIVAAQFDKSIKKMRQVSRTADTSKRFDMEGAILRRRKMATVNTFPQIKERYAEKYPCIPLEEEWAVCNVITTRPPHHMEEIYCLSLAAAIYILDALNHTHKMRNALKYLNWEQDELDDLWIPEVFDPCHSDDVLRGMTYLIQNRDINRKPPRPFTNEVTANRHEPIEYHEIEATSSLTCRERFDAIMDLIHPVYRERALERFESKQWEYLDLLFEQDAEYVKIEQTAVAAADRAGEEFDECRERLDKLAKERKRNPNQPAKAKNPLLVKLPTLDDVASGAYPFAGSNPLASSPYELELRRMDALADKGQAAEERANEAVANHHHFLWFSAATSLLQYDDMKKRHGKAVCKKFYDFTVADPYEICFAYLCQFESGSNLPWLYQSSGAVLCAAISKLPWLADDEIGGPWYADYVDDEDDEDCDWPEDAEPDKCKFPFVPKDYLMKRRSLYALKYKDGVMWPIMDGPSDMRMNLPQLVFATTNMLMPRDMHEIADYEKELVEAGIPKATAPFLAHYTLLANSVQYRTRNWSRFSVEDDVEDEDPEQSDMVADETTIEDLGKQIKALKGKNDELREALHDADKKARMAAEESKSTLDAARNEHQELLDLRELVFTLAAGEEPKNTPAAGVEFPYHTERNIVVFGGHATWLKAIQPMLPDVTLIDKDAQPSADLIRHADIVWIQSNALAHAFYYKIINVVRNHDVPIRYFGYASAEKCARQLIAVEEECKKAGGK